jgi:hypothetical protein
VADLEKFELCLLGTPWTIQVCSFADFKLQLCQPLLPLKFIHALLFFLACIYLKVSESFEWSFSACISESLDGILDMSSCFNFFEGRDATRRP